MRAGKAQLLQVQRAYDGKLRVGQWDRGMTFGDKLKEGVEDEFSERTFSQMIENWKARGEKLSYCYNHQSANTAKNGQPAPALAYANAVCVIRAGKVVQFEKLAASNAVPPDVADLAERVRLATATDENPNPSPDGCWWYRSEHTEMGENLLPGFAWLSPMFSGEAADENGKPIGYAIFDLAATNTPFQSGCVINFDRLDNGAPRAPVKERTMSKLAKVAKLIGFEKADATDNEIRAAVVQKYQAEGLRAFGNEGYDFASGAATLEEMAKAYEDANADEDDKDDEPPHNMMRKMAAKFRKLGIPADDSATMSTMARTVGLQAGASLSDIARAYEARTAPLSQLGELQAKVVTLESTLAARDAIEKKAAAQTFAQKAIDDGRTTEDKRDVVMMEHIEKGAASAERLLFAKHTFTAMRRFSNGQGGIVGKVEQGKVELAQDSPAAIQAEYVAKAKELAAKEKISYGAAVGRMKSAFPQLVAAYSASVRR